VVISQVQYSVLQTVINQGIAEASTALDAMVDCEVKLSVPNIELFDEVESKIAIFDHYRSSVSMVAMNFTGEIAGEASLFFLPESASVLVNALTGHALVDGELDALRMGTLTEVGNIIVNSILGSLCRGFEHPFTFSLPSYLEGSGNQIMQYGQYENVSLAIAHTSLQINELQVQAALMLFFHQGSFSKLIRVLEQEVRV